MLGDLSVLARPSVAIVGTRRDAVRGAHALAGALGAAGVCVVSGMARGIDAAARRAARARRHVRGVVGTGVDVAYPVGHRSLHATIAERGVIIPVPMRSRGARVLPRRSRIIAALGRLTIVVEAGERSGALITADHALDLGRDVGAVPGRSTHRSTLANGLLKNGAHTILGGAEPR